MTPRSPALARFRTPTVPATEGVGDGACSGRSLSDVPGCAISRAPGSGQCCAIGAGHRASRVTWHHPKPQKESAGRLGGQYQTLRTGHLCRPTPRNHRPRIGPNGLRFEGEESAVHGYGKFSFGDVKESCYDANMSCYRHVFRRTSKEKRASSHQTSSQTC